MAGRDARPRRAWGPSAWSSRTPSERARGSTCSRSPASAGWCWCRSTGPRSRWCGATRGTPPGVPTATTTASPPSTTTPGTTPATPTTTTPRWRSPAPHAADFVTRVRERLREAAQAAPGPLPGGGLVVCAIDTELLGHWWYEGVAWLAAVIEEAAAQGLALVRLDDAPALNEPRPLPAALRDESRASSWGHGGRPLDLVGAGGRGARLRGAGGRARAARGGARGAGGGAARAARAAVQRLGLPDHPRARGQLRPRALRRPPPPARPCAVRRRPRRGRRRPAQHRPRRAHLRPRRALRRLLGRAPQHDQRKARERRQGVVDHHADEGPLGSRQRLDAAVEGVAEVAGVALDLEADRANPRELRTRRPAAPGVVRAELRVARRTGAEQHPARERAGAACD